MNRMIICSTNENTVAVKVGLSGRQPSVTVHARDLRSQTLPSGRASLLLKKSCIGWTRVVTWLASIW